MDLGLRGRVALVVGGSGYIGREVARQLHSEGATVVLAARNDDALRDAAAEIGDDVDTVVVDTADQASVDAAVAAVVAEHGGIGVLVNTAAPPAQTLDPETLNEAGTVAAGIDGKSLGYLRVTNAVLPHMSEAGFGRVVSVSGQNYLLTSSVVTAARNAVVTVASKTLADQLAGTGVTLNVVDPGPVREDAPPDVAVGSPGPSTAEEVAAVVVFLASRLAGGVSGESVSVGHKVRGIVGY